MIRSVRLLSLWVLFVAVLGAKCLHAQQGAPLAVPDLASFSLPDQPRTITALDGRWRFQPGDTAAWADPHFDDSSWTLLPSTEPWPAKYTGLNGFAWYRFKVLVPANVGPLAIEVPRFYTSYQIFADGVFVGSPSPLALDKQIFRTTRAVYSVPNTTAAPHTIVFAIRVWQWHVWAPYRPGGPVGSTSFGAEAAVRRDAQLLTESNAWHNFDSEVLSIIKGIAGILVLALFFLQTKEKAYLWFAIAMLAEAASGCWNTWATYHTFWVVAGDNIQETITTLASVAYVFFYKDFLHARRGRLFQTVLICQIAMLLFGYVYLYFGFSVAVISAANFLLYLPFTVWTLILLVQSARRHVAEARLLLFPVVLNIALQAFFSIVWVSITAGWQNRYNATDVVLSQWPFIITLDDIADFLFLTALVAILAVRFARLAREQDRIHADLHAARTLQKMLIPEEHPETPGWSITTAYHPAQEVGGDFFQIVQVPAADGSATPDTVVLLGDAAGKGLPAAMTVSMLLGAFRTTAEASSSPAEILGSLNRRLNARGDGFTTAVALRLTSSGQLTLASAGHLSPYLNGEELPMEPALPLGVDPSQTLTECSFQLRPGDRVTLLTDGVPEARQHHELFGFERTRNLSNQQAHAIAEAALRFGQEDDVTVLSLVAV